MNKNVFNDSGTFMGANSGSGQQTMGDKMAINDLLASEKLLSSVYNTFTSECVNTNLRTDFLNILKEGHCIQNDLFLEMQKRGWYAVKQADQTMINDAKNKITSG